MTVQAGPDCSKVSVVAISFGRIAAVAECLKVAGVVPAPLVSRDDVVDLQGAFVRGDAAEFATKPSRLENVIADRAAYSLGGCSAMCPNVIAPALDVVAQFLITGLS